MLLGNCHFGHTYYSGNSSVFSNRNFKYSPQQNDIIAHLEAVVLTCQILTLQKHVQLMCL